MHLISPAFDHGAPIPPEHTCDGSNVSPELRWDDVPEGTQSLALIADDPDAPRGTWVHWVLYDLPADAQGLPARIPAGKTIAGGGTHGRNDFPELGYGGPCPPGGIHRYFFRLYALDRTLELEAGATKDRLLTAMQGHVLATAELMGTYRRR